MFLFDWIDKARESPAFRPAFIEILPENTTEVQPPAPFESQQDYFEVVVNEMYLSYKRKWLNEFDPTVFVLSEFEYEGQKVKVPVVVGPAMISQYKQNLPSGQGFLFKNTSVAGLHPYKGNSLDLTIILSRIPSASPLRKVINVIEKITGTYSNELKMAVSGYMKIAKVVLDTIESITNSDEIKPIIGIRNSYTRPGYYLLINQEADEFDPNQFFVTNKGLCYGDRNTEFRTQDYVLFSIRKTKTRNDVEQLPMFKTWRDMNTSISKILRKLSDDEKKVYRGQMLAMGTELMFSPDLTEPQATQLFETYSVKIEDQIKKRDALSGEKPAALRLEQDEWLTKMEKISQQVLK